MCEIDRARRARPGTNVASLEMMPNANPSRKNQWYANSKLQRIGQYEWMSLYFANNVIDYHRYELIFFFKKSQLKIPCKAATTSLSLIWICTNYKSKC
ncbi:unnamed protein product [Adineta ricciae]|uniref:Uncharacterized protein n=1 Tax=Adineta ricciae TaxID=249248 RepID=A0A815UB99_ADIRI|nr:unnamed protein product [Adineta ricciae]